MSAAQRPEPSLAGAVAGSELAGGELAARIAALHACGAAHFDPVGMRVIEAMLRRLDAFDGAARAALVRRIERRLTALRERYERAGGQMAIAAGCEQVRGGPAPRAGAPGPLAELLAHV
ncbi:MAG: hypothetical protein PWP40_358, partial [Rhodocyclaceae bacterium]|nr:hypothetical protein [Rhodocyclaceae bacterium]